MKRGRKSKLDAKLKRRICSLLAQGHTIRTVSETVGISERTYYEWCEKHFHFSQATTCAIGKSKIALVAKLRLSDDWRAQAFLLERRFRSEYGRVAEREMPLPQGEKHIGVTFVLTMPDGSQRLTSWEEARKMVAPACGQKELAYDEEGAPLDGSHATEPNGV